MEIIRFYLIAIVVFSFSLVKAQTYEITLSADPPQAGFLIGEGTYNHGDTVQVSGPPAMGWVFQNWTENEVIVSEDITYTFEITSDRHLIANYTEDIPNLIVQPSGLAFGNVETGQCQILQYTLYVQQPEKQFYYIQITAPEGYQVAHAPDQEFHDTIYYQYYGTFFGEDFLVKFCPTQAVEYTGDVVHQYPGAEPVNLPVSGTGTEEVYTVTLESNPPDAASNLNGAGTYTAGGQEVVVSAAANTGWSFLNWSEDGEVVSQTAEYSFIINHNRHLVANFEQQEHYNLTLSVHPDEAGEVSGQGSYLPGEVVTINASPGQGYSFSHWEGDTWAVEVSTIPDVSFSMPAEHLTLLAVFDATTNLPQTDTDDLMIYPNPAHEVLYVEFFNSLPTAISLYNLQGQLVETREVSASGPASINFQVNHLQSGIYLLAVSGGNQKKVYRVIIQ